MVFGIQSLCQKCYQIKFIAQIFWHQINFKQNQICKTSNTVVTSYTEETTEHYRCRTRRKIENKNNNRCRRDNQRNEISSFAFSVFLWAHINSTRTAKRLNSFLCFYFRGHRQWTRQSFGKFLTLILVIVSQCCFTTSRTV